MAKPVIKTATENLNEMLNRIRMENEALKRLIRALEIRTADTGENIKTKKS